MVVINLEESIMGELLSNDYRGFVVDVIIVVLG